MFSKKRTNLEFHMQLLVIEMFLKLLFTKNLAFQHFKVLQQKAEQ